MKNDKDLAAEKLATIIEKGTKRDFVGLYLLSRKYPLEQIIKFYNQRHKEFANGIYTIIKSICFFIDAEETEMPKMIKKVSWNEIKHFFEKEAVRLGKKYL